MLQKPLPVSEPGARRRAMSPGMREAIDKLLNDVHFCAALESRLIARIVLRDAEGREFSLNYSQLVMLSRAVRALKP